MDYQLIVDTDYILDLSKNISDTSNDISNSIESLQKVCNDLGYNVLDKNMQNFKNNFSSYLVSLKGLTTFYTSISSTINDLVKEYNNIDDTDASELKRNIVSNEEGGE